MVREDKKKGRATKHTRHVLLMPPALNTSMADPYIGGGNYMMKYYEGQEINRIMWLCQVTEFLFGDIPQQIFVKRVKE